MPIARSWASHASHAEDSVPLGGMAPPSRSSLGDLAARYGRLGDHVGRASGAVGGEVVGVAAGLV